MPSESLFKRTVAFFDGQNLFHQSRKAFGYSFPNYDPQKLSELICQEKLWELREVHFYTGIPSQIDKPNWHHFWTAKMAVMGTRGIRTFSRSLRYRNQSIGLPNGSTTVALIGQEKGVDVRIALDIVRLALDDC